MRWQTINFERLIEQLIPTFIRKDKMLELLKCYAKPLQTLADKTLYQMQHDSRVIYLEKVLNEYFEVATYNPNSHIATRQIYIVDTPQASKNYIYQEQENNPMYLGTAYLDREIELQQYQFIVKIPSAIAYNEARLRALIDFYKLAGKRYLIETY